MEIKGKAHEDRRQESDSTEFVPEQHLIFSDPRHKWTLQDMGLEESSVTSFAVSGNFSLFSSAAIAKMRRELLSDTVRQKFQSSSSIVECQLWGMVPDYANFTYNAWNHPKTLAAIAKVVGLNLVPVMDKETSNVNILPSGNGDHHSIQWQRDDYPLVCVLMLSDTTYMNGGAILVKTGSNGLVLHDPPETGSAYILNGIHIEYAVCPFRSSERITAVTSFRPQNPFIEDQTQLRTVRAVSDRRQLYFQFVQYRWWIAVERLEALKKWLNGEMVQLKSSSLWENLKEIHHLLQNTSTQIGMPLDCTKTESSKVNKVSLTMPYSVYLYSSGMDLAIAGLRRGLDEQERGLDWDLALSTFNFADCTLHHLMQGDY